MKIDDKGGKVRTKICKCIMGEVKVGYGQTGSNIEE
jgi:hypothetical protein